MIDTTVESVHMTHFFEDSLCGLKKVTERNLTYQLSKVTCAACLEASRLEAIENQKALDTLPRCETCGLTASQVTLTFTVTKSYRLDVQTERDWESKTIKPLIYGSDYDTLDTEMVNDPSWQVSCENGHEWFTKQITPIEDGAQWFVTAVKDKQVNIPVCTICGCDPSEHNWEAHYAELKANS
jgi:hypothetical protein